MVDGPGCKPNTINSNAPVSLTASSMPTPSPGPTSSRLAHPSSWSMSMHPNLRTGTDKNFTRIESCHAVNVASLHRRRPGTNNDRGRDDGGDVESQCGTPDRDVSIR